MCLTDKADRRNRWQTSETDGKTDWRTGIEKDRGNRKQSRQEEQEARQTGRTGSETDRRIRRRDRQEDQEARQTGYEAGQTSSTGMIPEMLVTTI